MIGTVCYDVTPGTCNILEKIEAVEAITYEGFITERYENEQATNARCWDSVVLSSHSYGASHVTTCVLFTCQADKSEWKPFSETQRL